MILLHLYAPLFIYLFIYFILGYVLYGILVHCDFVAN